VNRGSEEVGRNLYHQSILGGRASASAEIQGTITLYVRDNVPDGMSRGEVEILFRAE
jgi:hypothetical protein